MRKSIIAKQTLLLYMQKAFPTITTCFIFFCCNSKEQPKIDTISSENAAKEGFEFVKKTLEIDIKDTVALIGLNKKAIEKFELAYRYDSTNRHSWSWLSECYYNIGEFEKAIYWCKKDIDFIKSDSVILGINYETIGLSFLNLGEFEKAKTNFKKALIYYKNYDTGIGTIIERIKKASEHIYKKENKKQIAKLQNKNLDPCSYSIMVYEYAVKLYQDYYKFNLPSDEMVLESKRQNCG